MIYNLFQAITKDIMNNINDIINDIVNNKKGYHIVNDINHIMNDKKSSSGHKPDGLLVIFTDRVA